jgi:hypothetical protein
MAREVDFAGVISFIAKRRKATGGYGATPRLPATIEDTFEVVAISQELAQLAPGLFQAHPPADDPELHDYLRATAQRTWPGLRTTCQLIQTCFYLGIPIDVERARRYSAGHRAEKGDLATAYYAALIDREVSSGKASAVAIRLPPLPARLTVAELRMHLRLAKLAGTTPAGHDELLAWLRRCQNGDGGFGFFPGTTSFIENCHHTLAALQLLGGAPREPEQARQFVLSCQTGRGGFGRSLRAAPFLDSTWHALACLRLLATFPWQP